MTNGEISKVIEQVDAAWGSPEGPLMNPNMPTEVAAYRAMLEVASQLAFLNERMDHWESRSTPLRVLVEPGDWPVVVKEGKS